MAATIDATVGGADANSYASLAEFTEWADERQPSTAFDGATTDQKNRALISATRRLDQERYKGVRVDGVQALQWPRDGVEEPDLAGGAWYGSDEIPDRIKRAQMELAYQTLAGNASPDDTGLEGFKNVKVGSLDVTPNHTRRAGVLPESVRREIRELLAAGGDSVRLVRG